MTWLITVLVGIEFSVDLRVALLYYFSHAEERCYEVVVRLTNAKVVAGRE
jgi:ribosome-binding factor A